jgi:hypothetical protein
MTYDFDNFINRVASDYYIESDDINNIDDYVNDCIRYEVYDLNETRENNIKHMINIINSYGGFYEAVELIKRMVGNFNYSTKIEFYFKLASYCLYDKVYHNIIIKINEDETLSDAPTVEVVD